MEIDVIFAPGIMPGVFFKWGDSPIFGDDDGL